MTSPSDVTDGFHKELWVYDSAGRKSVKLAVLPTGFTTRPTTLVKDPSCFCY
eukprot:c29912_g1_i1 orf=10-165(-)